MNALVMQGRLAWLRRLGHLARPVLAGLPLLLLWPAARHLIESRMSWHMLIEFPLLLAAGWAAHRLSSGWAPLRRIGQHARLLDWHGWSTATYCALVSIVWMVPSALDMALIDGRVALLKVFSLWLAGWLLAGGLARMPAEVLLFLAGNLGWMMATAGLLYAETPTQLCVNYGQNDQVHTGHGLVAWALVIGAIALRQVVRLAGAHDEAQAKPRAEPARDGPRAQRSPRAT
ncbi:MAG: hypothetical protein Q4G70_13835 [Pseudomonadota bacterium]|nr:hypothetical protein [Pseudomonadota bacterium]